MFFLNGQPSIEKPPIVDTIETFAIIGNPNRRGTKNTTNYLKNFIEYKIPDNQKKRVLFVPTGRTSEETRDNLKSSSIDGSKTCLVIIGGDGTIKNCFDAGLDLNNNDSSNYQISNLLTAFQGTAKDMPYNLGSKSNRKSFEKNFPKLEEKFFYPIELSINGKKHTVYNVASIGLVGTMGASIENMKEKLPKITPRMLVLGLASLAIAKTLIKHSSFEITDQEVSEITDQEVSYHKAVDWIIANGKRFGVVFKTGGSLLDTSFREYELKNIRSSDISDVISRRPHAPDAVIQPGQTTTRNFRTNDRNFELTVDGEKSQLPPMGTIIARVATEPVKVFTA